MKTIASVILALLVSGSVAPADIILIDFGGGSNPAPGWNSPDPPYMPTNLMTVTGTDTGIEMFPWSWSNGDGDGTGVYPTTAPWSEPAVGSYFRQIFTTYVEFSNVDTNFSYTFELISSTPSSFYGGYFRLNGEYADNNPDGTYFSSHYDGYLTGIVMVWSNVVPDAIGDIMLEVQRGDPRSGVAINAMRITIVPEPETAALLAAGLCALSIWKRSPNKRLLRTGDPRTARQSAEP